MFEVLVLLFIIKFYACSNVKQNKTKQNKKVKTKNVRLARNDQICMVDKNGYSCFTYSLIQKFTQYQIVSSKSKGFE